MKDKKILDKIKQIVESGNYDVEELLSVIPKELLLDVKDLIENQAKQESNEIKIDMTEKIK